MTKKFFWVFGFMLSLASMATLTGCPDGDKAVATTNPNSAVLKPVGTIIGALRDTVTLEPIVGAVVTTGNHTATTDSRGRYVLADVAASKDELNGTVKGTYTLTVDLKNVTSPIDMTSTSSTAVKYPKFAHFDGATVGFTSLNDSSPCPDADDSEDGNVQNQALASCGTNASNHDTPVDGLVGSWDMTVGKLDAHVEGVVAECNNLAKAAGQGLIVKVYAHNSNNDTGSGAAGHRLDNTETKDDGSFKFDGLESGLSVDFSVENSDGTIFDMLTSITLPMDGETLHLSNFQNAAENILFACSNDTIGPALNATPESGSDLPATSVDVVFTFTEAIKETTATGTDPGAIDNLFDNIEVNLVGSKAGNIAHSLAWTSSNTVLTVSIPTTGVSSLYYVRLKDVGDLTDVEGNAVSLGDCPDDSVVPSDYGLVVDADNDDCTVYFTTKGSQDAAQVAEPTLVNKDAMDQATLDAAILDWPRASGAKEYNIYCRVIQVWDDNTTNVHAYSFTASTTISSAVLSLDGTPGGDIDYSDDGLVENLEIPLQHECFVAGVNADEKEGEGSSPVMIEDNRGPLLVNGVVISCGNAPDVICDNAGDMTAFTVTFNEPLDETTAETAANYTVTHDDINGSLTTTNVTSAIYDASTLKVELTLASPIVLANLYPNTIDTGADGLLDTTIATVGDDVAVITTVGNGTPNTICVGAGTNVIVDSTPAGDDTISGTTIISGANGKCESTAVGDDTQTLPVGKGLANQTAITAGVNGVLDTATASGDDFRGIFLSVANVTDVTGDVVNNVIRSEGDASSIDGTVD